MGVKMSSSKKSTFECWDALHSVWRSHSIAKCHLLLLGHRFSLESRAADSTTGAKFTDESESTSQADFFKPNTLFPPQNYKTKEVSNLTEQKKKKFQNVSDVQSETLHSCWK